MDFTQVFKCWILVLENSIMQKMDMPEPERDKAEPLIGLKSGKFNLRLTVLQDLLDSLGDASSAKINSLKQIIRRNKWEFL